MLSTKLKWIITLSLLLLMALLSACSSEKQSVSVSDFSQISNAFISESVLPIDSTNEAENVRLRMKKMLSNEYAELYLGSSYDIALIDKRTSKVWYSNEAIYSEEIDNYTDEQKNYAYSQLIVDYYRNELAEVRITSYPECYNGEQKNQVTTEVNDNVLSVRYAFGTDMESRIIFQYISVEKYKEIESAAKKAIEDKKISNSSWGRMKASYNMSEDGSYYVLNPSATYIQTDNIEKVCKQLGYTNNDVQEEEKKLGVSGELSSTTPNFVITIKYSLDHADLMVTVDIDEINEPSGYYLNRVSVLPGFGATTTTDDGYMVFADGGGTLINNNSISTEKDEMRIVFYGEDEAESKRTETERLAESAFPIFGIKSENASVFAIVESGDAISGVDVLRANHTYVNNMVAPWFSYRIRGTVSSEQRIGHMNYVYSQCITQRPYVVRYHLLYDTRASYSGMAEYYRSYLISTGGIIPTETGSEWYEDVNIIGALSGNRSVYGVEVESALAASDYASVQNWITNMDEQQIHVNYEGVFNEGVDGKAPLRLKSVSSLGSDEQRDSILNESFVYPALSIQRVAKSGNGIKSNTDIAKAINKEYAFYATYNPATGQIKNNELKSFLISPLSYKKIALGLTEAYKKYNGNTLLLKDAASILYSDFNVSSTVSREDSKLYLCQSLQVLKDEGFSLKLDGINAYALKYGDAFTNIPTSSRKVGFMDYEIPFVGMVLHGIVPYSVKPLNEASNYEDALFDMLESGANPSWRIITGDMSILSDTQYTCYYSASADYWTKEIKSLDQKLKDFYTTISKEVIIEHSVLPNGLVRITYSNGYKTYINRTTEVQKDGNVSVESRSFYLCNERGEEQ